MSNQTIELFFSCRPDAFTVYRLLEDQLLARCAPTSVEVRQTQISFRSRYIYACVSLPRSKKALSGSIVVSFGLPCRVDSPRIDACVEAASNRWTHHVVVTAPDIDGELLGWLQQAFAFANSPFRR